MVIDKENTQKNPQPEKKKNLFSAFFPREYDFESMLAHQSDWTVSGCTGIHIMAGNASSFQSP